MAILNLSGAPYGGRVRLLPDNAGAPRITPRLFIAHSIVGSLEGAYRMFRDTSNLESTLGVGLDGHIEQWMDTERQADANYHANPFALSVETEDRGDPDTQPWTPEQLEALVWLARECHRIHPAIKLQRAPAWDGAGIGYHTMWGAPSAWTPVQKSCPGRVRIRQFDDVLLPRIVGGEEIDMATLEEIKDAIADLRRDLTVQGTTGLERTVEDFATRQRAALAKLDDLAGKVSADSGRVDTLAAAVVAMGDEIKALREQVAALPGGTAPPLDGHYTATIALARIEG